MKILKILLPILVIATVFPNLACAQDVTAQQRREIAHRIITVSAQVKPHEVVVISGNSAFMPLMEDLAIELSKAGGYAVFMPVSDRMLRAVLTEIPEQYYGQPDPLLAWLKNIDVIIDLPFLYNEEEVTHEVPQARIAKLVGNGDDQFRKAAQDSRVRSVSIDAPLPSQARIFGFDLASFSTMQWKAIGADSLAIEQSGKRLAEALGGGGTVHVTSPEGSEFTFKAGPQQPLVSGGITRPRENNLDERNANLPAGYVAAPLAPGSFQGKIFTPEDYCTGLTKLTGVSYEFSGGRLKDFNAQQNAKCLQDYFAAYSGPKDEVVSVQIGLNPYLKSQSQTAPFNAAGMLWVFLGRDARFGFTGTQMYWAIPVTHATIDVGGREVVKNGQLQEQ